MNLPARVQSNIARQQRQSEFLVAFAQLAIVALLAVFYLAAPAGYSPDAPIKAAPLGMSLFAILVLLRLYFARTEQLNAWLIGVFTVLEMAVLIGTIWAYHLQFEQPAIVSLKNTAFFYVFILLALRALRFEPQWVAISGITAALGWGGMVWYALASAQHNLLTWDYVTYVTTEKIHLGGESDKILSVLLVAFVLALSLARARRMLERSVAQAQAASDLSMFFDDDVARQITGADNALKAGQGETRNAAVLFTDMRGFSIAAASAPASEVIALLREYQSLVVPIIQSHGGSIDKFLGDGILASFGAVKPSGAYAADGFRAVDAIMAAVDQWRAKRAAAGLVAPDVGAGLAVGEVVFGIIGDEKRLEYTVIGDTVNLAAKLEKHNKIEHSRALSTAAALEEAVGQGYAGAQKERRAGRSVGGVKDPVDVVLWT